MMRYIFFVRFSVTNYKVSCPLRLIEDNSTISKGFKRLDYVCDYLWKLSTWASVKGNESSEFYAEEL